jgi:hypothetical protein
MEWVFDVATNDTTQLLLIERDLILGVFQMLEYVLGSLQDVVVTTSWESAGVSRRALAEVMEHYTVKVRVYIPHMTAKAVASKIPDYLNDLIALKMIELDACNNGSVQCNITFDASKYPVVKAISAPVVE